MPAARIDTKQLIDEHPFGPYQVCIFLMCFAIATLDGFDSIMIGAAVPGMLATLKLQPVAIGWIFTLQALGVIAGAIVLGSLADRVGRKHMLIAATLIFGFFSLLIAYSTTFTEIAIYRALSGVGLGGAVPSALAFGCEYAPQRMRATVTTGIWLALPLGGMLSGFTGIWLIPHYGWTILFMVGGIVPLIVAALAYMLLPESLSYLSERGIDQAQMRRIAVRIAPELGNQPDAQFYSSEEKAPGVPVARLFTDGRAVSTLLLWAVFFLSFFIMIFFVSWAPTLLTKLGATQQQASGTLVAWNIGSMLATLIIGRLIDKTGYFRVLPWAFIVIALAVWVLGALVTQSYLIVAFLIAVVGFFVGGSNSGLMALAATSYPVSLRSTGVGWAYGVGGRVGAMVGPMLGGVLLQNGWSAGEICYVMGLPVLLGSGVLWLLKRETERRNQGATSPITPSPVPAE
jgi:AAHS family 4-hydroxybenzoate transporter-like MFS transporter